MDWRKTKKGKSTEKEIRKEFEVTWNALGNGWTMIGEEGKEKRRGEGN